MAFSPFSLLLVSCLFGYLAHGSPTDPQLKFSGNTYRILFQKLVNNVVFLMSLTNSLEQIDDELSSLTFKQMVSLDLT